MLSNRSLLRVRIKNLRLIKMKPRKGKNKTFDEMKRKNQNQKQNMLRNPKTKLNHKKIEPVKQLN